MKRIQRIILLLLSITVTGVVFRHLFKEVSLNQLITTLKSLSPLGITSFILLSLTGSVVRSWRYQLILQWSGERVSTGPLFLITLVRNLFSDLLPARIGTLIYVYLVHTRAGVTLSSASSSFGLSFLFDLISLPIVALSLYSITSSDAFSPMLFAILLGVIVVSFTLVMLLPTCISLTNTILKSLTSIPVLTRNSLINFFTQISEEVSHVRALTPFSQLLVLSIFVRITKYGSLIIFLYTLLTPLGYSTGEISPIEAFIGILSSELAASLPASGIAGFGAYEGTWATIFRLLGLPGAIADLTALAHHLFTQIYGYSLGIVGFLGLLTIPLSQEKRVPQQPRASFIVKIMIASVFIGLAIFIGTSLPIATPPEARPMERPCEISNCDTEKNVTFNAEALPSTGGIIFDSNRSGTFGIYALSRIHPNGVAVVDSTTHHEMYPSISSENGNIVYARSRTTQRLEPAEIWILPQHAQKPSRLFTNGTFPSYTQNNSEILFERGRKSVMKYSFENQKIEKLFPFSKNQFKANQIVKPRLSPNGRYLTFTSDRPSPWHVWLIDLETKSEHLISHGCESTFHPKEDSGLFILQQNVLGGSAIGSFDIFKKASTKQIIDSKGPLSHEYFPSYSFTGEHILFSAAPNNQHSHLTASYALFIKTLKDNEEAQQLTFDVFTNRWPQYTRNLPLTILSASRKHESYG